MIDYKRFAAEAFSHANKMDKRVWGKSGAKIGFVAAGKNWLDLVHALSLLGIDEAEAERLGLTTYKVGQTFPLDMKGFHDWAEGLDLIIVVEEKRKLVEVQIKEAIFDDRRGRRVYGWHKGGGAGSMHGEELFPTRGALDPFMIAEKLGDIPDRRGPRHRRLKARITVVITGVGGTGVVTVGAVLAQAAQIDGKGAGMMEMAGLAQKGGAVHIHCRLAERPEDISAIRVATGEAHALIGGDLVVSAGAKTLGLTQTDRTGAVVNSHEIITGDFTRNTEFSLPSDKLEVALRARLRGRLDLFDASDLARATLGDSIFSNMMILGAAWQRGLVPLSKDAITAIGDFERCGRRKEFARF
ncbi:Indolepyruvate oxidoreductase subunit IorB [Nymphon striatum]|nr:Indolepyruvate oxidoreductase subunit IorB [Nymphon striatum]